MGPDPLDPRRRACCETKPAAVRLTGECRMAPRSTSEDRAKPPPRFSPVLTSSSKDYSGLGKAPRKYRGHSVTGAATDHATAYVVGVSGKQAQSQCHGLTTLLAIWLSCTEAVCLSPQPSLAGETLVAKASDQSLCGFERRKTGRSDRASLGGRGVYRRRHPHCEVGGWRSRRFGHAASRQAIL